MNVNHLELTGDELDAVTGGGLVDTVLADAESSTNEFLKRFAETSQRVSAFINAAPAANQTSAEQG